MNEKIMRIAAEEAIKRLAGTRPAVALVMGSGWADAMALEPLHTVEYASLPGLGATRVAGHPGRLWVARQGEAHVLVFQGRRHWYEGDGWEPVAFPVYLARAMEVSTLILTNASGGIRPDLNPGDIMAIEDHINLMGVNPLHGAHDPFWGAAFPDQNAVYTRQLLAVAKESAEACKIVLRQGVYAAVSGPTYETPAEVRALKALGADAVGMSTVPEATLANAAGLRVAALSCIANRAAGTGTGFLSHAEAIAVTRAVLPRMTALLGEIVRRLTLAPP